MIRIVVMAVKKVKEEKKDPTSLGPSELDPKEEKVLDKILNGVVIFVLGWLALGVLLSIGGLFHLWK